jgi:hypothetical protein
MILFSEKSFYQENFPPSLSETGISFFYPHHAALRFFRKKGRKILLVGKFPKRRSSIRAQVVPLCSDQTR